MGITHSKKLGRSFSRSSRHLAAKSKVTLLNRKSSSKASLSIDNNENNNRNSLLDDPRAGDYLPPSPISKYKEIYTISNTPAETLMINDRIYQNTNKKYILPIDDEEQDRLVQEHFLYKFIFGGNFSAPLRDLLSGPYSEQSKRNSVESSNWIIENISPPRVLDIACGNGTWILEMATEFPNSEFYGIDFSPSYPTTVKPGNSFFTKHDILSSDGLPYPDNYFDYVFMRQVYTCFSESDWMFVVREIRRVVKPGGYVEFRDLDPMLRKMGNKSSNIFERYPGLMKEKHGVNVFWARYMFNYLQDIGEMTDMHIQVSEIRFGSSGPIGEMLEISLRSAFESHRLFLENCYDIFRKDYDQVIDDIINESITHRSFFNYYVCWGRKPLLDYDTSSSARRQSSSISSIPAIDDTIIDKSDYQFSKFSMEQGNNSDDVISFDADNVSDIDQFIEGFED